MVKKFNRSELRTFGGKNGTPVYVVNNKKVYDVTESPLWKNGIHAKVHNAGADLTADLMNAPHGKDVFERYPVIGEFVEPVEVFRETFGEKNAVAGFLASIETAGIERRFHRMTSHFPISLLMTASLFLLLYEYTGNGSFEVAAYYTLSLGVAASPLSVLSGLWSWKVTYLGLMTRIFKAKIIFSISLLVIGLLCVILRTLNPAIIIEGSFLSWIYFVMVMSLTPQVITLGYYGGKIVFLKAF